MKDLFTNKYFIILLVITTALLLTIAVYTTERKKVTVAEDVAYNILTPIQHLFTGATSGVSDFFDYFKDVKKIQQDNVDLATKVAELENKNRALEEYQTENIRLKEMLAFKEENKDLDLIAATVIAKDPGNWFNSFTINRGTSDGIQNKMTVVTSLGVVGRIYEVGTNWAKVISIIDSSSSIGALITRTGDIAMVEGDVELGIDGLCKMTYISKGSSVITGDLVETSGLGGIYPKGLLIGKVREIRTENEGVSQYAIVEPVANFDKVTEVFVINNGDEKIENGGNNGGER